MASTRSTRLSTWLRMGSAAVLALAGTTTVTAQAATHYPSQPITVIVPFPAAGGVDLVGRMLAEQINRSSGANLIIENRAGAGGTIGIGTLARAAPDGYTVGLGSPGNISIAPAIFPSLTYDPAKNLQPVAQAVQVPVLVITRPDAPYKDVAGLIAHAKAHPGELTYASGGAGTSQHLGGALFAQEAGIDVLHVPYKGTSPALTDLMAGRVDFMFADVSVMPSVKAGKIGLLAVGSATRASVLPDVPTVSESGLPGFETLNWYGVFLPAGTAPEAVLWLNARVQEALRDPGLIAKLNAQMFEVPPPATPGDFAAFVEADTKKWAAVVDSAKIKIE